MVSSIKDGCWAGKLEVYGGQRVCIPVLGGPG